MTRRELSEVRLLGAILNVRVNASARGAGYSVEIWHGPTNEMVQTASHNEAMRIIESAAQPMCYAPDLRLAMGLDRDKGLESEENG